MCVSVVGFPDQIFLSDLTSLVRVCGDSALEN